jgi:hypothetical protein
MPMSAFADLELELAPRSGREDYTVQVRFSEPLTEFVRGLVQMSVEA